MRIITLNINGVRSGSRKNFFQWLPRQNADILCLQETKIQAEQLTDPVFYPEGYNVYYSHALKKGYSGTAIYTKVKPVKVTEGFGWHGCDDEGRYLQADFPGLSVVSLYMPSGSSGEIRQAHKYAFMDHFYAHLVALRKKRRQFIICGDWNIAHRQIDIKNWRGNQKNSGFLPEERAWLDKVFNELAYVDAFRQVNQEPDQYTWWSNRGRAWEKNVGWRIDYQIVTPGLKNRIKAVNIYKDERFSDHAPLITDYEYDL